MRSYAQFCPIARALDVIGERWALLIVRELLIHPARFTDLRRGLPGIASNLLTERLRTLEEAVIVERTELPPPAASAVYQLTERGFALRHVLREVARWGAPLLDERPNDDAVDSHWLVRFATMAFRDVPTAELGPLSASIRVGPSAISLFVAANGVSISAQPAANPNVVITADAEHAVALLTGAISPANARAQAAARFDGPGGAVAQLDALLARIGAPPTPNPS